MVYILGVLMEGNKLAALAKDLSRRLISANSDESTQSENPNLAILLGFLDAIGDGRAGAKLVDLILQTVFQITTSSSAEIPADVARSIARHLVPALLEAKAGRTGVTR